MALHVAVTFSITLARSRGYRVVSTLRYAKASAASGFTIPTEAQLRRFLEQFALAPEALAASLTSVQAGSPALLRFGAIDQDYAERALRHYTQG